MSSLKDSEEQTSLWLVMPGRWEVAEREAGSRGEQFLGSLVCFSRQVRRRRGEERREGGGEAQ
ncbi:hypothetical protein EYF80_046249 [Liparis tanakae]|uniref:Uncharacterized protein n=1 Tax=Liparis tanakae TaxID=230148 RepID=A0A4Z2FQR4_9TELE|nr:hypothetical protein EYF80_046249 [Liparis tanakae]